MIPTGAITFRSTDTSTVTRTGLGASHQTGWTGIIARAMHLFATTTPEQALEIGKLAAVTETAEKAQSAASKAMAGGKR